MDEEAKQEEENEKWEREAREKKARDEERTRKNREKRNKKKNKKGGENDTTQKPAHGIVDDGNAMGESASPVKKKNGAQQVPRRGSQDEAETADLADGAVAEENGITILDDD